MSMKVLRASARGGKTEWAVNQSRACAAGLSGSPYVLLPSRTQVDDFKKRLSNDGGTMGVHLGTFRDLAQEIVDRSDTNLIVISEAAQLKLLQSVLDNIPLVYFQRIKHKTGFGQIMLAIIRELEAGMIDPEVFQSAVQQIEPTGRMVELALIYQEFRKKLVNKNWVDPTGLVWMAVNILTGNSEIIPKWDQLIIDGFDDLSPVQLELIAALSRSLPDVTITITGSEEGSIRPLVHKRFIYLLAELKKKQEVDQIFIDNKEKPLESGVFEKLENTLFSREIKHELETGNQIKMIAVPDREGEVRTALRWIKKLIVEEKIIPDQASLVMRNLEPYRKIVDKVAREYQLPVFIKGGLALGENPAVAAIMSLLKLAGNGKKGLVWQDVISIWKSPYFDWRLLTPGINDEKFPQRHTADVKQLSEIARWGSVINGYGQWQEAFERLIAIPARDENSYSGNSVPGSVPAGQEAQALWEKFNSFVEFITPPDDGLAVEAYLFWIENLMGDLSVEEDRVSGLNLFQMALEGGSELFLRDSQAIKRLVGIFRETIWSDLMFSLGPGGFDDVLRDLESEIKRQSYQIADDEAGRVTCADCTEVRGVSFPAVALIGLAEGEFPGTIKEDPFLRNADRIILKEKFGFPLRLSTESAEAEFFYEAVTRASKWLLLTRPRIADNGAPWQPSPYWEEIIRATGLTPDMRTSRNVPALENSASMSELFEGIADVGIEKREKLLPEIKKTYPDYFNQVSTAQKVIWARTGRSENSDLKYDGNLEHLSNELQVRFPEEQVWSPSRLENYQTCPLNFYVNNLLGLEKTEPPQEGLDARQLGNIYHHIMEDLYLAVGSDYDIQKLLAELPDIARKVFLEAPDREGFRETAWWHHTQLEILTNIKHSLIVLEELDSSFKFFRAEQKFGIRKNSAPQLDIKVEGGGTYHLRGLIDRVDINKNGSLRIIDYKTSSPFGFDNQAVREGKKLQLPLYALAAQSGLQLGDVQEGFYFHVRSAQPSSFKMSSFWNDGERGSQTAIKTAVLKGWQAVVSIQNGDFAPRPPANGCPAYCPAVDFCWHYQRKVW